jgi:hypothetical protein
MAKKAMTMRRLRNLIVAAIEHQERHREEWAIGKNPEADPGTRTEYLKSTYRAVTLYDVLSAMDGDLGPLKSLAKF